MTEYDFSPEAIDAYIQKQAKISNWVNNTNRHPPANSFTTATPPLLDRPFPKTQFRTAVRRPLSRQRVWDEEDALRMGRPRRERRASDSEQGGQIEGRSGQGLGDPSEGLSNRTIGAQSGERRSLERSQERATQFRTAVRRPLSRQRVWDEEDALRMSRPRRERRASDSEQGESRFGQGLGDPSEGLSSRTIGVQSGERRSLERSQERAEGEKRRRAEEKLMRRQAEEKKRHQIEEEKLRRQAEEKLRRQVEEEKLRREAAEEKLHRVEAKLLHVEEKLRRAEEKLHRAEEEESLRKQHLVEQQRSARERRNWDEEHEYTQRVDNLRTAQQLLLIVEQDMLLKGRPLVGPEGLYSGTTEVQSGRHRSQERQTQALPETDARPLSGGAPADEEVLGPPPPWSPPVGNGGRF